MNRKERRLSKRYYSRQLKNAVFDNFEDMSTEFEEIRRLAGKSNNHVVGFFKNSIYSVQIFRNKQGYKLLGIRRHDEKALSNWSHFQKIKNEFAGENEWAIEVYPAENKKVDQANMYWLWCYPKGQRPDVDLNATIKGQ